MSDWLLAAMFPCLVFAVVVLAVLWRAADASARYWRGECERLERVRQADADFPGSGIEGHWDDNDYCEEDYP